MLLYNKLPKLGACNATYYTTKPIESHVEPFFKSSMKSSLKKRQNDSNCECQCYQEYEQDKHGEDRLSSFQLFSSPKSSHSATFINVTARGAVQTYQFMTEQVD